MDQQKEKTGPSNSVRLAHKPRDDERTSRRTEQTKDRQKQADGQTKPKTDRSKQTDRPNQRQIEASRRTDQTNDRQKQADGQTKPKTDRSKPETKMTAIIPTTKQTTRTNKNNNMKG